jgi:hypothetical protein
VRESKTTINLVKKLTNRKRRILIVALVIVPFFYPFLLVWFAHGDLDGMYVKAKILPDLFRDVAASEVNCSADVSALKEKAHKALLRCGGVLPTDSYGPLGSRRLLKDLNLPLLDRGFAIWRQTGKAWLVPREIWDRTEEECHQAAEKLNKAADDFETVLTSYEQTRTLTWVLLYLWLVAEVFGWIVVVHFARRLLREQAEARASSQ